MIRRPSSIDNLSKVESPPKISPQMFSRSVPQEINFEILNCIPIGILILENSNIVGCNLTFTKYTLFDNNNIKNYSVNDLISCDMKDKVIAKKNLQNVQEIIESITRMQESVINKVNIYNKNKVIVSNMIIRHNGRFCIITFPGFSDLSTD